MQEDLILWLSNAAGLMLSVDAKVPAQQASSLRKRDSSFRSCELHVER